ncbi:hypothetical protein GALMADRAFT_259903 [Galerina marginata CBS 339.88]|uniref:C2H2-type domain-containing protein n=1 Tax=Galerina marginata (strain CBS 339.88) TaxID=685588 RepID=A0A067S578_GALM3|nr:hypothetical protein GALMADRAFT_259903 [Galerina marginata CBS 339.88]
MENLFYEDACILAQWMPSLPSCASSQCQVCRYGLLENFLDCGLFDWPYEGNAAQLSSYPASPWQASIFSSTISPSNLCSPLLKCLAQSRQPTMYQVPINSDTTSSLPDLPSSFPSPSSQPSPGFGFSLPSFACSSMDSTDSNLYQEAVNATTVVLRNSTPSRNTASQHIRRFSNAISGCENTDAITSMPDFSSSAFSPPHLPSSSPSSFSQRPPELGFSMPSFACSPMGSTDSYSYLYQEAVDANPVPRNSTPVRDAASNQHIRRFSSVITDCATIDATSVPGLSSSSFSQPDLPCSSPSPILQPPPGISMPSFPCSSADSTDSYPYQEVVDAKPVLRSSTTVRNVASRQQIRRFSCVIAGCERRCVSRYHLGVHIKAHNTKPKRSLPCTMGCSETFSRLHDRLRHEVGQHGKVCEFTCYECGRFFSMQTTLNSHKCAPPP